MRMIDKHIGSKFSGTDVFIMTGGTRKRGATWSYYFDLGKIDGKRQKKEKGGFKTKKEAETALAKAINEYNNAGAVFTPSEITVSDYLDQWYDLYCKPNLKYSTQVNYLRIIEGHLKPKYGQYRLKAITSAILQEYANSLKLNGLAKSSVVGILSVFGASLDYAVEPMHYLSVNPMRYVKFPKIERKPRERIVLTMDDWNRIIERFPVGSRFHIPLMIGFYTGLRISEAFALTWDDIDLEKRELTVNKQVVVRNFGADVRKVIEKKGKKELRSSWYFTTPKTQSSSRTVKFGETLYQALKQERTTQMENELKYGEYYTIHVIKKELDEKNIPYKKDIEVGIMVETAAASLMADVFAKEAAFFSIGTNDLTQYTMSVDRGNDKVSYLYSTFNPAVLRSIKRIITCGREAGIMVGMCGEAASDPLMIPLLLAFGLNEFSMSASAILFSRKLITGYSVEELQAVADKAMSFATAAEVEAYMKAFAAGQA